MYLTYSTHNHSNSSKIEANLDIASVVSVPWVRGDNVGEDTSVLRAVVGEQKKGRGDWESGEARHVHV